MKGEKGRRHVDTFVDWDRFKGCNNTIKKYALNSQFQYEKNCADQIQQNQKKNYYHIKHKKICRPTVGRIRSTEGIIT